MFSVTCLSRNARTHDYRATRVSKGFVLNAHVNKRLYLMTSCSTVYSRGERQPSDRAAQHSANTLRQKEEGDHNRMWRLLRWPDVRDGRGQATQQHTTQDTEIQRSQSLHILSGATRSREPVCEITDPHFTTVFISKIVWSCGLIVSAIKPSDVQERNNHHV